MDDGRSVEAAEAAIHLEATSLNLYDGYHRYAAHLLGTITLLPQRIHLYPAAVFGTATFLQRNHLATSLEEAGTGGFIADMMNSVYLNVPRITAYMQFVPKVVRVVENDASDNDVPELENSSEEDYDDEQSG